MFSLVAARSSVIGHRVADFRGFFEWSLLDNVRWSGGYTKRFGLELFNARSVKRASLPSAR